MFEQYSANYISQRLSLRKPQEESLEILDNVLSQIDIISKSMDLNEELEIVRSLYPTCTSFERDFMSLAFVLATGVGKTRLMGAFIAYLYTVKGLKHFFVVAPNTVIYEKLRSDLGDTTSDKYVFRGLDCFAVNPPRIVTGDDYRERQLSFNELYSDVTIYIYNISKFDKDQAKMRSINEMLGRSFIETLAGIDDLVLLMDESHHYHAAKGAQALNDLKPILGLELTATPYYNVKSKQKKFSNAVYEYPLSYSIRDGYTRTPYALTRSDYKTYGFDDDMGDQVILRDAIVSHERTKTLLANYSQETGKKLVKPFVLVVCKDTNHANNVYDYICSENFFDGRYTNKTIIIHSGQKAEEKEDNIALLQDVENADNPVEIVIHVNKLKEGWDVNNLYTIVPLRTAASKVLREQMVGRGLRLPYGERTGVKEIDMVVLTAHDNFNELLKEAQSGESIFHKDKVLYADNLDPMISYKQVVSQPQLSFPKETIRIGEVELTTGEQKMLLQTIDEEVSQSYKPHSTGEIDSHQVADVAIKNLIKSSEDNADRQEIYNKNIGPLAVYAAKLVDERIVFTKSKFIPIPRIRIRDAEVSEYEFRDFDLDLSVFKHKPTDQRLYLANLQNQADTDVIVGQGLTFGESPRSKLITLLREKPQVNYSQHADLLQKLVGQLLDYFTYEFGSDGMENIVFMNSKDLAERIYLQMMKKDHFIKHTGLFVEEVEDYLDQNYASNLNGTATYDLFYDPPRKIDIPSFVFNNIEKGVFESAKFDSYSELLFARILERDNDVKNWLRPSKEQFEIYYDGGQRYEPDFVVETEKETYLVEVKGEHLLADPSVAAKAQRGQAYCRLATAFAKANSKKPWIYLFLLSNTIAADSSFKFLLNQNYADAICQRNE